MSIYHDDEASALTDEEYIAVQQNGGYAPNVEAGVINAVSTGIGEWAIGHGFREGWEMADWLEALAEYLDKEERFTTDDTKGYPGLDLDGHGVSTVDGLKGAASLMRDLWLGTKLMLAVTELAEAMEKLRDVGAAGVLNGEDGGNFGEELADTVVRLADLSHNVSSSLGDQIMRKVAINDKRPYKHGRRV